MTACLDHIVINARFEIDRAQDIFTRLGFTLTPRGHHTMGSYNHLMMFATDYLELVGIAETQAHKRPEIANAGPGLDAMVFKTDDADQTFARLEAHGMAGDPPKSFSRPVTLAGGVTHDARFRTVTARADAFPAARLYFCEHLTPELLWREEWQGHRNTVSGFSALIIVAADGGHDSAACLAELLGAPLEENDDRAWQVTLADGFRLIFLGPGDHAARFGGFTRGGVDRSAFLGALSLRCAAPDTMRKFAEDIGARCAETDDGRLALAIDAFDTLLLLEKQDG